MRAGAQRFQGHSGDLSEEMVAALEAKVAEVDGDGGGSITEDVLARLRGARPFADFPGDSPKGTAQKSPPRAPRVHAVPMAVAPPPPAEEFAAMMETAGHHLFELPAAPSLLPPLLQCQGTPRATWGWAQIASTTGSLASVTSEVHGARVQTGCKAHSKGARVLKC
ncbi:unnamed protein product [Prorocentrum cordatum]|uniref:EF-hand domain-containing protein n=1 Tax=Prorocentrum cordatum TaxID=2364126 RepID=A0ABN9SEC7_9DINO|nr:unnamed protein product [Polarella glacialis]